MTRFAEHRVALLALTAFSVFPGALTGQAPVQAGRAVQGRVVVENGGAAPRFTLPVMAPGRSATPVAINPRPDGTFTVNLPEGLSMAGAVTGLPAGATVRSLTYGSANLLRDPFTVTPLDNAELVITIDMPRPVSIRGRVTGLRSPGGVIVALNGANLDASVNPDGSFLFPQVPPGSYRARLIYGGASVEVSVTVGATDVTGLTIPVPKEHVVTGLVMVEGGARTPAIAVDAKSRAGATVSSTIPSAYQGTNAGQFFLMKLEDGEYSMSVRNIPAGYRVKSITYGTTDLLNEPLTLDGLAVWTITIRLAQ